MKPHWDLRGAFEDLQLLGEVGYRVANTEVYPTCKAASELKATREAMLKAGKGGTN